MAVAVLSPWEACSTITERFPALSGRPLLDTLRNTYVLVEDKNVSFWNGEHWRFIRHKVNNRGYGHTRRKYQDF